MIAVPTATTTPKFHTKVIEGRLQPVFAAISWMGKAFALAHIGIRKDHGYPQVYLNNGTGNHGDISPDSSQDAYCFFEMNGTAEVEDMNVAYPFSVVVWANLKLVRPAAGYDFTGELIQDCLTELKQLEALDVEVEQRPGEVFTNYSEQSQKNNQFAMNPYSCFRIDFTLNDSCI